MRIGKQIAALAAQFQELPVGGGGIYDALYVWTRRPRQLLGTSVLQKIKLGKYLETLKPTAQQTAIRLYTGSS